MKESLNGKYVDERGFADSGRGGGDESTERSKTVSKCPQKSSQRCSKRIPIQFILEI